MKHEELRGKRIFIAGSIPDEANIERAKYAQVLTKHLAKCILSRGGGLIVTLGSEPKLTKDDAVAKIFDWTILEAVDEIQKYPNAKWPNAQGAPVIAVGFGNWEERIPTDRRDLWERIFSTNKVELHIVPAEISVGGVMRQEQTKYGDILVTIGGHIGVHHLAQLFQASKKPVIPINLPLGNGQLTASEVLSNHAVKDPNDFFEYQPPRGAITAYSKLSLKLRILEVKDFGKRFFDFVNHLPQPIAFNVRLLNSQLLEFKDVEGFFRNVVDKVVADMGYRRFEMETDSSEEPFMNVELFEKLHFSALVIADLTGVRPNCCLELGYALALGKKVILTAMEGTKLPWDTEMIRCHFWSISETDVKRKALLESFMEKNINKMPLVR